MVDVATLQQVALATGGSRGGRADHHLGWPRAAEPDRRRSTRSARPSRRQVVGTNPPDASVTPLPLPYLSVVVRRRRAGRLARPQGACVNPANYKLVGANGGAVAAVGLVYNASSRTVLLEFGTLLPDTYTLSVSNVASTDGVAMQTPYVTTFQALGDLTGIVGITVTGTRTDRTNNTVSYTVTLTNNGTRPLSLPAVLVLDPNNGTLGLPQGTTGETDDGRYLIDLSGELPANGILAPGASVDGDTVTITTTNNDRADFTIGVSAASVADVAPVFVTTPPKATAVGQTFTYQAQATSATGNALIYNLLSGPAGLTINPQPAS